jgi:UDP-N-acetyl-D-glucosamine dehydrogenase
LKNTLADKLDNHTAVIGVFGLGYVGLPLAIEYCQQGYRCIGFEISPKKINMVNAGKSDIGDVSNAQVRSAVSKKLLKATADFSLPSSAMLPRSACQRLSPKPKTRMFPTFYWRLRN